MYEEQEYRPMGTTKTVLLHAFYPDFDMGEDGPVNRSPIPNNPRFIWMLQDGPEIVDMFVTEPGETVEYGDISVTFTDYHRYTGLQVVHDPGVPLFFLGSGIMVLGLLFSFYLYPRRIWAVIMPGEQDEQDGQAKVIIGGKGLKDRKNFQLEMEKLVSQLKDQYNSD